MAFSRRLRNSAIGVAALSGAGLVLYTRKTRPFKRFDDPSIPQFVHQRPPTREESLKQLLEAADPAKALDVLVVGGGATGTGIALDLASRGGLSVGLVEANDYASETSSRSSKLIHGGVRYLEKAVFNLDPMQLKLVFEALRERAVVCHQAPFLVHPIETIIPCYRPYDLALFWCGMKAYDFLAALGGGVIGGLSGFNGPITTMNYYPHLKHLREGDTLLGSVTYYDGQHWDSRLCLHIAMTAACFGAATVNHCRLMRVGEGNNNNATKATSSTAVATTNASTHSVLTPEGLHKCVIRDTINQTDHVIYAKALVNATGPFSDSVREMLDSEHKPLVRPSHGTHITLPAKYAPKDRAMLVQSSDGRVLFCINYLGHCIAGTTDVETEVQEAPRPPEKDIEFILNNMRPLLGNIDRSEVLSTWCGIRPLAAPEPVKGKEAPKDSQNIVREHSIAVNKDLKILSITGGKWTTYRKMAEDVVQSLKDHELIDSRKMKVTTKNSPTEDIVLFGAQHFDKDKVSLHVKGNVPFKYLDHWRSTFGDQYETLYNMALEAGKNKKVPAASAPAVPTQSTSSSPAESVNTRGKIAGLGEDESKMLLPTAKLSPLCPSLPFLDVDVVYSARYESCERVQDFIARRSGIAFLNVEETKAAIPKIADLMAREKKWSNNRKLAEIGDAYKYLNTFTSVVA